MRVGLLLTRLPLPLRNDQLVKTTKPSIELATGKNKGNKDKAVRRYKEATRRNTTRRNGRRTTPSSTRKIVCGNEVVDLDDVACALTQIITAKGLY